MRLHTRIGLDTSVFIYLINTTSPFSAIAADAFQQLQQQSMTGVTSVLTLTELLVKPLQTDRRGLAARYEALVRSMPNVAVVDIDARRSSSRSAAGETRDLDCRLPPDCSGSRTRGHCVRDERSSAPSHGRDCPHPACGSS